MSPPVISHKGRLRNARLTNAREARQRGDGVTRIARNNLEVASESVSSPSPRKKIQGWQVLQVSAGRTQPFAMLRFQPFRFRLRLGLH